MTHEQYAPYTTREQHIPNVADLFVDVFSERIKGGDRPIAEWVDEWRKCSQIVDEIRKEAAKHSYQWLKAFRKDP